MSTVAYLSVLKLDQTVSKIEKYENLIILWMQTKCIEHLHCNLKVKISKIKLP
jgi:hypothetical protein